MITGSSVRGARSRRGSTLAEVSIMSMLALLISSVTVGLMYETGLAVKNVYAETRTRATRMIALDQIRYELGGAVVDSIEITNSSHRIEFGNRKNGWTTVSRFDFIPSTRKLLYDDDISDDEGSVVVAHGPIDLTFELDDESSGGLVRVNVKSAAEVAFGDVDAQDGETAIFLRNA
jgi:hypothetical protein